MPARTSTTIGRVRHGLVTAAAVLGIVAASVVGLNDLADEVAVHVTPTSQDAGPLG